MNVQEASDVTERSGIASRLIKVLVYMTLGSLVTWRAWTYQLGVGEAYPLIPMILCACLVAVLYTLSVVTLLGRSEVLTTVAVGERDDSTRRRAAGRATA
jgi:hypothetical protein